MYILRFLNPFGQFLFDFDEIISLSSNRVKNDIGITTLTIPFDTYDYLSFTEDSRLEIYRISDNGDVNLFDDTCWFLRAKELSFNDGTGEITLTFEDSVGLLARRQVAWLGLTAIEISPTESVSPNYPSVITESYMDIIKLIFFYNFNDGVTSPTLANTYWSTWEPVTNFVGPGDSYPGISFWQSQVYDGDMLNRKFAISQDAPDNQGLITPVPSSRHDFVTCLNAMQDVAESAKLQKQNIWFDVLYTPSNTTYGKSNFYFKTWLGVRGERKTNNFNSLTIGPEYGNINDFRHTVDWSERKSLVYAAGSGDNELRELNSARDEGGINNLPFYPIEAFITPQQSDSLNALKLEAEKEIAKSRPQEIYSGNIVSQQGTEFYTDFRYGDILRFQFGDLIDEVEIGEYTIDISSDSIDISIPFGNQDDVE